MIANLRRLSCVIVAVAALGACSGTSDATSKAGTRLLATATAAGRRASAVSFEVQARGRGRSDEAFARNGDDSLVRAEYDDGGLLEVRRVVGEVYVRTALRIEGAPASGPWIRLAAGADQSTWLALLGSDLGAPSPEEATAMFAANVDRVTGLRIEPTARILAVAPDPVDAGERPSSIAVRPGEALISGRRAALYAGGDRVSSRTYRRVRWGDRAAAIEAPTDAVPVDGVVDPQAAALASTLLREPAALPAGWTRRATVGITPAQGSGTCQEVATVYAAPAPTSLTEGYLALYLEPSGCEPLRQAGAADFTAGPNRGWVGRDPSSGATVGALTVAGTTVRFRSSLPPATLAGLLATWRPSTAD